jgi:hypothetical protein
MTDGNRQYIRKASLLLVSGDQALDLSDMHFKFRTVQEDEQSPSNCAVRVYNLSDATVKRIRGEFSRVVVQAGYDSSFGVVFDGTIIQYGIGRESGTNTYLDILAADGDVAYNFAVVNASLSAGSSAGERIAKTIQAMEPLGVSAGSILADGTGGILPRGKVLFGMAKSILRSQVQNVGATWSINSGKINITPLTGYLPGEAVILNSLTGMIGRPEQTQEGIKVRCLINPKITVGGTVQIDNTDINQLVQQNPDAAPVPYNQWAGVQNLASVTADGVYRVYVVEYTGDTRGPEWYADLVCLTVDPSTQKVKAYG